jgi:IS5 family transposase
VRDFWDFSVKFARPATADFFRSRIDHMIDLRHPLAVLASRMPWQQIEGSVAHLLSRTARSGIAMPNLDLFGEQVQRSERLSQAGSPRVPLRIMVSLLYLKHAFNESDEGVVERWRNAGATVSARARPEHPTNSASRWALAARTKAT